MATGPKEFEDYLVGLTDEQYDSLMIERIQRLAPEEQSIVEAREHKKKIRRDLASKIAEPNATEETHQLVFDTIRDMETYECEHGRSYGKHCIACGKIDHTMFPELFDEDGLPINE